MKDKSTHFSQVFSMTLPKSARVELAIVLGLLVIIFVLLSTKSGFWSVSPMSPYTDQLRQAVLKCELDKARQFLAEGSYDVDSINESGMTILMDAVAAGHGDMVALLLRYLADPSIRNGKTGDSPLVMAVRNHREDIAGLLLAHGADANTVDAEGDNVLMTAIRNGLTDLCRLLLPKTANLTQRDSNGNTALMLAAERGNLEVLILLLDQEILVPVTNHQGETALSLAVRGGFLDVVKALLQAGAQIRSELDIAASNYDKALVRLLLEKGAPISHNSTSKLLKRAQQLNDRDFLAFLQRYGMIRSMSGL